jgi:hypothetical protein
VLAGGAAGKLPAVRSGVEVSRRGVLVTAFGPNPDGAGTVLRLWEQSGKSGDCIVWVPDSFHTAQPVNLRGVPAGKPLPIRHGKFALDLPAFAPYTVVLK